MPDDFRLPEVDEDDIHVVEQNRPDPLYERQASLGLSKPNVILVGAGGVGCWVALALVLGGVDDITIYDGDTISVHNLNRFPLPESNVGELKSVALARWLRTLRPKANDINARGEFDPTIGSPFTDDKAINWLVCCTDSLKSRKMCYNFANDYAINYLEVGADGERWTLSPAPPEFSTELEDNPGYQTVPVHVGPCMMAGAAVSYYVLHNQMPYVSHLVDWDKGPVYRSNQARASLHIAKMDEGKPYISSYPMLTCTKCHRKIEGEIINTIRHIRECMNLDLIGAKTLAEEWIAKAPPVPLNEAEIEELADMIQIAQSHTSEVGEWTPEQARSHDEYVALNESGEFNLVDVNDARGRLGLPLIEEDTYIEGDIEEDNNEQSQ